MSAFIQQLPALIGVVIGALGSYVAIVRGDRARFGREQTARWEERRLAVYTDYARCLKKTITLTYRVAAHLGNDPTRIRCRRRRRLRCCPRPPRPGTRPVRPCCSWAVRRWWRSRAPGSSW